MSETSTKQWGCDRCSIAEYGLHLPSDWSSVEIRRGFSGRQTKHLCDDCTAGFDEWFTSDDIGKQPPTLSDRMLQLFMDSPEEAFSLEQIRRRLSVGGARSTRPAKRSVTSILQGFVTSNTIAAYASRQIVEGDISSTPSRMEELIFQLKDE